MTAFDSSPYADSAQARQLDRDLAARSKPKVASEFQAPVSYHEYDAEAAKARELEAKQRLKARIGVAMGQMETILGIGEGEA